MACSAETWAGFCSDPSFHSTSLIFCRIRVKIQVMTGISGVTFEECYREKFIVEVDGLNIPFISYEKIVVNKNSTKRNKDKVDVEELAKRKKKGL